MSAISIVIPIYNAEKELSRCLNSLVNQTFDDLEIICVNDGSTDNTLKILNEYKAKDSRIKIINTKNGGPGRARNIGIKQAKGEYLLFVDSDDWIRLNSCEILYHTAKEQKLDILQFQYFNAYSSDDYHISDKSGKLAISVYNKLYDSRALQKEEFHTFYMWDKLWSRSFYIEHNLMNREGCYYEEVVTVLKMIYGISIFSIIKDPFYFHCSPPGSISSAIPADKHLKSRTWEMEDCLNFLKSKHVLDTDFSIRIISGELKQIMRQPWARSCRKSIKRLVRNTALTMKISLSKVKYQQFYQMTFRNKTFLLFLLPHSINLAFGNTYRFLLRKILRLRS